MAKPLSILLVEDSPTDALLLEENLHQVVEFDFDLAVVNSLHGGLEKLVGKTYDAIILDLSLPDSFGLQTLDSVRAAGQNIPIVIYSGNDDRHLLTEALQRGADNYLIKDSADGNRIAIAILSAIRNRHSSS